MNVIVVCACVPTLLPLVQQVTGQKDYRSRRGPCPEALNEYYQSRPKRSLLNKTPTRTIVPRENIDAIAFHNDEREKGRPLGEIPPTNDLDTH